MRKEIVNQEEDVVLYRTIKGKDVKLQEGDKININIVLDFEVDVHKDAKGNFLIAKDHKVKRKEVITRDVKSNSLCK